MADKDVSGINLIGPFSQPLNIEWPDYYGFLCEVHGDATSPAYGYPLYPQKDGKDIPGSARIFPGTEGGTTPMALFGKKKQTGIATGADYTVWKEYRTQNLQSVGAINWWGPDHEGTKHKWILSYAGPKTRHFPDQFQYGSTNDHREIYANGGIVGIAPGPVTGAALILIPESLKTAEPTIKDYKYFVVCVCIVGGKEKVYRNLLKPPVFKRNVTDAVFEYLTGMKDHDFQNPQDGWVLLGEIGLPDYKTPRTPFFFSEDGTRASAIRLKDKTFVPDTATGVEVTEEIGSRITLTIPSSVDTITYSDEGNDAPYSWVETGDITDYGVVNIGNSANGLNYKQEEHMFAGVGAMGGTQIVAVDFKGNDEIICRYRVVGQRGFSKIWVKRISDTTSWLADLGLPDTAPNRAYVNSLSTATEDPTTPSSVYGIYYNTQLQDPPNPNHEFHLGMESPNHPPNHQDTVFYRDYVLNTLEWVSGGKQQMAVVEIGKMSPIKGDPTNTLAETLAAKVFIRHLDLRAPFLLAHIEEEHVYYQPVDHADPAKYRRESYCRDFSNLEETTYTHIASSNPEPVVGVDAFTSPLRIANPDDWATMKSLWPEGTGHWEWRATTYRAGAPSTNDDNSKGKINSKSKYSPDNPSLITKSWVGFDVLMGHPHQTQELGVGINPDGDYLVSMNAPDVDTTDGTMRLYISQSDSMDVETTLGGRRLYPLGAI